MNPRRVVSTVDGLLSLACVVLLLLAVSRLGRAQRVLQVDDKGPESSDKYLLVELRVKRIVPEAKPLIQSRFPENLGWRSVVMPAGCDELTIIYFAAEPGVSTPGDRPAAKAIPMFGQLDKDPWINGYAIHAFRVRGERPVRVGDFQLTPLATPISGQGKFPELISILNDKLKSSTALATRFEP